MSNGSSSRLAKLRCGDFTPSSHSRTSGPVAIAGFVGSGPRASGTSTAITRWPSAVQSTVVTSVASNGARAACADLPVATSAT